MTNRAGSSHASEGPRFAAKRDWWVSLLLWVAVATMVGASWMVLGDPDADPAARIGMLATSVGSVAFVLWLLYGTYYGFREGELYARSGPFRWRVPLQSIDEVRPSHNPLSAPAPSLDRLAVRYRNGRRLLLISPADKAAFLRALVARAPHLGIEGDRAVRVGTDP
jgi:hypothetical protein